MTKKDLIKTIAQQAGETQVITEKLFNQIFETLGEEFAKGNSVMIPSFGTFQVKERKARNAIHPMTGQALSIPAHKVVVFKPGKSLKEAVK